MGGKRAGRWVGGLMGVSSVIMCATIGLAATRAARLFVARRYIAPPGLGPAFTQVWYQPPRLRLGRERYPVAEQEAEEIELRLSEWLRADHRGAGNIRESWSGYALLFEKVASDEGYKVVVRGFDRADLLSPLPGDRPAPVTVQSLREMQVADGGCVVWRVLYDVRTSAFSNLECNGE
jgi:hypothetical protein